MVTGANGFLGQALVRRLVAEGGLGGGESPMTQLTLVGRKLPRSHRDMRIRYVDGDIRDAATQMAIVDGGVDCLFHLAGALIDRTEPDFDYGRSVNLDASLALIDALRECKQPRVIFTSTIAVYGPASRNINDDTVPRPILSYGTHKLMVEEYLNDVTWRGSSMRGQCGYPERCRVHVCRIGHFRRPSPATSSMPSSQAKYSILPCRQRAKFGCYRCKAVSRT